MKGYTGKILHVDLTNKKTKIEKPSEDFYRRYIGGNGFIAYYLLKQLKAGVNPLGPQNILIFATGPFTGAPIAGSGRNAVGAKSPLTGGYGEADVGGFFGAELKRAGFDAIVINGKAAKPVYLWIHNGQVKIRSAASIWGTTTLECMQKVRAEVGEKAARIAAIGPSGEKLVRYACIMNDLKHAAGRTGLGAVMGSKNLKCIAARGTERVSVADAKAVKELGQYMRDNWREFSLSMHDMGTTAGLMGLNESGALPTRNFQDGQFEGAKHISGETMRDTILVSRESCYGCPVRCKRAVSIKDDEYQVNKLYGGPEYETMGAFGSNCGIDDLRAISKANELCNAFGVDTISTGMAVSFAMECYENGLLKKKDTKGLDLKFGNAKAMVELTRQICEREGMGKLFANGIEKAIEKIGPRAKKYNISVKGQPFPMHECRTRHGQGLGYAVSPTGPDHMHNFWDNGMAQEELGDKLKEVGIYSPVPQTVLNTDKVRAYMYTVNWQWLINHLGLCMFIGWTREQVARILEGLTGWQTNVWELMRAGERGVTMAREFNMREGFSRKDDKLPARIAEPHVSGSLNEKPIKPKDLDEALTMFYGMMGWDTRTGKPTDVKLRELDLEWLVDG